MGLLELWSQAGFADDRFWKQTPRTLVAVLNGYRRRQREEHTGYTYVARLAAVLGRWPKDKNLPPMKDLLKPAESRKRRQDPAEMLAAFEDMKAAGAPIKIRKVG